MKKVFPCGFLFSRDSLFFEFPREPGNYRIRLSPCRDRESPVMAVKTGSRRLLTEAWPLEPENPKIFSATVHLASPVLRDGRTIPLEGKERGFRNWSGKISLEFLASQPRLECIELEEDARSITFYLAGDSTLTDQETAPWSAWGAMFPCFFKEGLAVANYAKSGASLLSFEQENRWAKLSELYKPGDYLLLEFGHNDQKPGDFYSSSFGDFQKRLKEQCIRAMDSGVHPVLATPLMRRKFDSIGKIRNTHQDYPDAVRELATELTLPLLDMSKMSKRLFEILGPEESRKALLHLPAGSYPDLEEDLADDTHFSCYGAYQMASAAANSLWESLPELQPFFRKRPVWDQNRPTPPENWKLPISPLYDD